MKLKYVKTIGLIVGAIVAVIAIPTTFAALIWVVVYVIRTWGCGGVYCNFNQDGVATIWGALIGLFGGMAALGGAIFIGVRQVGIVATQTDILEQQTVIARNGLDLERLKIRVELYDRRVSVYEKSLAVIDFFLTYDRVPGYVAVRGEPVPPEEMAIRREFFRAISESQFLFRPEVHKSLLELSSLGRKIHINKKKMETPLGTEGRNEAYLQASGLEEMMAEFERNLPTIFGEELNLSDASIAQPAASKPGRT